MKLELIKEYDEFITEASWDEVNYDNDKNISIEELWMKYTKDDLHYAVVEDFFIAYERLLTKGYKQKLTKKLTEKVLDFYFTKENIAAGTEHLAMTVYHNAFDKSLKDQFILVWLCSELEFDANDANEYVDYSNYKKLELNMHGNVIDKVSFLQNIPAKTKINGQVIFGDEFGDSKIKNIKSGPAYIRTLVVRTLNTELVPKVFKKTKFEDIVIDELSSLKVLDSINKMVYKTLEVGKFIGHDLTSMTSTTRGSIYAPYLESIKGYKKTKNAITFEVPEENHMKIEEEIINMGYETLEDFENEFNIYIAMGD